MHYHRVSNVNLPQTNDRCVMAFNQFDQMVELCVCKDGWGGLYCLDPIANVCDQCNAIGTISCETIEGSAYTQAICTCKEGEYTGVFCQDIIPILMDDSKL
eukprot:UN05137